MTVQVWPPSMLLYRPPPQAPAYTVWVEDGSMARNATQEANPWEAGPQDRPPSVDLKAPPPRVPA